MEPKSETAVIDGSRLNLDYILQKLKLLKVLVVKPG
jgi:hypothetical protein